PTHVRLDPNVFFNWGTGDPFWSNLGGYSTNSSDPSFPGDNFSARWEGYFKPPASGVYDLGLRTDDGSRLWINDSLVVDDWSNHGLLSPVPATHVHLMAG